MTVYDFGQASGSYYIAMELIRGVDFDQMIYSPHGPLPPSLISGVLVQALEGLHAAHHARGEDGTSLGLVHRDLSPHNLMVGFDGRVKVLDFGVAKTRHQRTVTLPGIVKGKPLYMSPEQATGEPVDARSDLFSMGLILFEALSGSRAFDRQDDTKTMESIVNDPLERPPTIPQPFWEVLERALSKRPQARYRSALEMASAVAAAAAPIPVEALGALLWARFPGRAAEQARWTTGTAPARNPPTSVDTGS